ncbi:MAG TPA: hypothetical protein VKA86_06315 [Candidatus Krumholzibacteria bacterium]|nr:hypothetical protein [Candidatus Krumholzibacteria bacterium]
MAARSPIASPTRTWSEGSGWEFGIGPNVIAIAGDGDPELQTSLVTAAGYTFRYSGVNLPVNVALAHNPEGTRLSLVFGYAIRR